MRFLRHAWPYALIALVVLLVWGHTVRFEFVWDDRQFIQESPSIRSLKQVPGMFYSLGAQSSFPEGFKLFRPLRTVHYALLYVLGGKAEPQPWLFHLANVLWHAGAAMLLYGVALALFSRAPGRNGPLATRGFALLAALAFATHPVVSEVVCWAKSLDDIMATVFTLAATRALLRWPGDRKQYSLALFWFLLAVYSKESAVPFAAVAFVIFYKIHHAGWWRSLRLSLGFLAVALVFLVHRHLVIGQTSQTAPISGSYGQTLVDMLPVVPKYLRLLSGTPPFRIDYSFLHGHEVWSAAPVWFGLALLGLALVLGVWAWRQPGAEVSALGLCWLGLFLLPVSNLVPMMQYLAERFLYLPMIGAIVAVGALLVRAPRPRFNAALAGLGVLAWAGIAWDRSLIWKDELTLFVQSSLQRPRTPRVEENAVAAIFNLPHLRTVFLPVDTRHKARRLRAPLPSNLDAALNTLTEAHRLFPDDETVSTALAILYARTGKYPLAIPLFEAATRRAPTNSMYWTDLGQACVEAHEWDQARKALTRALALDTNNVEAWRASSSLFWQQQDLPAALAVFKQLKRLEPGNAEHDYWIRRVEDQMRSTPAPARR